MRDLFERLVDWGKAVWCGARGHKWEATPTYQYRTLFSNMQTGQELSRSRVQVTCCERCPATKTRTLE